jgi:hypothetical protein
LPNQCSTLTDSVRAQPPRLSESAATRQTSTAIAAKSQRAKTATASIAIKSNTIRSRETQAGKPPRASEIPIPNSAKQRTIGNQLFTKTISIDHACRHDTQTIALPQKQTINAAKLGFLSPIIAKTGKRRLAAHSVLIDQSGGFNKVEDAGSTFHRCTSAASLTMKNHHLK